jgi:large subunit ribosomal protein L6
MSRIGIQSITLPGSVSVTIGEDAVRVKGPRGETAVSRPASIDVRRDGGELCVSRTSEDSQTRAMHGTVRSLLANAVEGVEKGFSRSLEITGVGYRVVLQGRELVLSLGFSHPIHFPIPDGIDIQVDGTTALTVSGIDKQQVGQVAARLRGFAPAEPYKGKGVRYKNEKIRRKVGKAVA